MNKISRRKFFQASIALAAVSQISRIGEAFAQDSFTLPALPFAFDALEPIIDAETMKIHHGKHHQGYVDKLNEQVTKLLALANKSLEQILASVSSYPDAVRNNAGGHFNHSFFWSILAPVGKGGAASPELERHIATDLGGSEKFQQAFTEAALTRFGSGWVWLVLTSDKKLAVASTPYQDNPLMDNATVKGQPILALDVWEHAYYLRYQNKRADYVKGWWSVINWSEVNQRYAKAIQSKR